MGGMSEEWRGFDLAVSRWRIGELAIEGLPEAAIEALEAGCDTPSLGVLAGMDGRGWSELEPVVQSVLVERGVPLPSRAEAIKSVADAVLRQVVAGEVDPRDATLRLMRLVSGPQTPAWEDLVVFSSLSFDWDSADEGRVDEAAVRHEVLAQANRILDQGGVRTG